MAKTSKITKSKNENDIWEYKDGQVLATLNSDGKTYCEIMEFSSYEPGNGHGRSALKWLKKKFPELSVSDPGTEEETPESFGFWRRMADDGLIHSMTDENSNVIFDNGSWLVDEIDPDAYPTLHADLTRVAVLR